jgi:uncharacterized SAM-dependent methyltransferase
MSLVSRVDQRINFNGVEISFRAGEPLRTEYSYKYSIAEFRDIAALAGYRVKQVWTDPQQWFSLHYLHPA